MQKCLVIGRGLERLDQTYRGGFIKTLPASLRVNVIEFTMLFKYATHVCML